MSAHLVAGVSRDRRVATSSRRPLDGPLCFVLAIALTACGGTTDPADGGDAGVTVHPDGHVTPPPDGGRLPPGAEPEALLELVTLDVWGQPLAADVATLTVQRAGADERTYGWPEALVLLRGEARYEVTLSAPDHEALAIGVDFAGGTTLDAITVDADGAIGHGVSVSHERRVVDGVELPVHTVYLGLRHRWFSAQGRPARAGNDLTLFIAGDTAWAAVASEIEGASESVHAASWWWGSDFEMIREEGSHPYLSAAERQPNTVLAHLDRTGATARVLVGQLVGQDGLLSWATVDDPLLERAMTPGDGFEFMGQANETRGEFLFEVAPFYFRDVLATRWSAAAGRTFDDELPIESTVPPHMVDLTDWPVDVDVQHASYHQKFWVIDGRVAFIGGMNLRPVDWDTERHEVFEPRRMMFDAPAADRLDVVNREALPDNGPRKDYVVRIEGPAVQDAEDVFHMRWQHQLDEAVEHSEYASSYTVRRDQAPIADGVLAQVTATLPEPFWEHAIIETWFNAIDNAEDYILIEDQYFRIPMLVDLIIERMTLQPELRLIVITKPVSEYTDPGCEWTHRTHQELVALFPDRYELYQLRAFDFVRDTLEPDETEERFQDMDIHSKLLIVDDRFLSVGSCNKNNRGAVYEGELNLAVLDDAWVRAARRRILENILGAGASVSDDPEVWAGQLRAAAAANQSVWDAWVDEGGDIDLNGAPLPAMYTPSGFLYPLSFRTPDDCLIESVGPDMT